MNTAPLLIEEFATSVLAVPPLARRADLSLDVAQNQRLIRHIEAGGQRILLYGGNANLYHCGLQDYAQMLGMLASSTLDTTRVIPAIGPDFGKMMDQARLLRGSGYRTAMVLPMQGFTSPEGVAEGISRFVDAAGMPVLVSMMMGAITAVFGGVSRDVLCNEVPKVYSDHRPYAMCALFGCGVFLALDAIGLPLPIATLAGIAAATGSRLLALVFDVRLPAWPAHRD